MMKIEIYVIFIYLVVGISCDYQLKHVQVVFRHGDRAPTVIYPKDQNQANKWPSGLGQLTEDGIRQHFQLGLWLRNRYNSLIGPTLVYSDIHVRSTNIDRTLMSAESNLAGFVFNEGHKIINGLPWRPISVHTVRESLDYLLEFNVCPRYVKERIELYNLDYFKRKFAPYQSVLLNIRQQTGINDLTFLNIWEVYDAIFCEKTHNMTVNDWVTNEMWANLTIINTINWELMFHGELAKLAGGLLLHTIIDRMKNISTNASMAKDGQKYVLYSGHDTDVAPLAQLLGFYDNIQPAYASSIILELYYNDAIINDPWAVSILYKNNSDAHTHIVPGCPPGLCPLSRFIELTKHKTMSKDDFMAQCGLKTNILFYVELAFGMVCVAVFLLVCVMFFVRSHRNHRAQGGPRYSRFPDDKCLN